MLSEFVNAVYEEKKDVINIIYYLYALVYCKIFYIWFKSILGNHEITLYSYFLSSDINWNGSRRIDIYCSSTIDHWWNYRTCNVTFVNNQRGVCKVNGNESEMVHCRSYAIVLSIFTILNSSMP